MKNQLKSIILSLLVLAAAIACNSDDNKRNTGTGKTDGDQGIDVNSPKPLAILLTDWGTPEGWDYEYGIEINARSLLGLWPAALECQDNYIGLEGNENPIGLLPPALTGNFTDEQKPYVSQQGLYDEHGVYWLNTTTGTYESGLRDENGNPRHTITEAEVAEHSLEVIPMAASEDGDAPLTGRVVFTPDKRDGTDFLAGYYQIMLPPGNGLTERGNGLIDIQELSFASNIRSTHIGSSNETPVENATVMLVEQETEKG